MQKGEQWWGLHLYGLLPKRVVKMEGDGSGGGVGRGFSWEV
jgi:hypothetical protein